MRLGFVLLVSGLFLGCASRMVGARTPSSAYESGRYKQLCLDVPSDIQAGAQDPTCRLEKFHMFSYINGHNQLSCVNPFANSRTGEFYSLDQYRWNDVRDGGTDNTGTKLWRYLRPSRLYYTFRGTNLTSKINATEISKGLTLYDLINGEENPAPYYAPDRIAGVLFADLNRIAHVEKLDIVIAINRSELIITGFDLFAPYTDASHDVSIRARP